MSRNDTFETVYPRFDFAPLVDLAIAFGGAVKRWSAKFDHGRHASQAGADAGMGHAA